MEHLRSDLVELGHYEYWEHATIAPPRFGREEPAEQVERIRQQLIVSANRKPGDRRWVVGKPRGVDQGKEDWAPEQTPRRFIEYRIVVPQVRDLVGGDSSHLNPNGREFGILLGPGTSDLRQRTTPKPKHERKGVFFPVDIGVGKLSHTELDVDSLQPSERLPIRVESKLVGVLGSESHLSGVEQPHEGGETGAAVAEDER
jgi:hypothetical protein